MPTESWEMEWDHRPLLVTTLTLSWSVQVQGSRQHCKIDVSKGERRVDAGLAVTQVLHTHTLCLHKLLLVDSGILCVRLPRQARTSVNGRTCCSPPFSAWIHML